MSAKLVHSSSGNLHEQQQVQKKKKTHPIRCHTMNNWLQSTVCTHTVHSWCTCAAAPTATWTVHPTASNPIRRQVSNAGTQAAEAYRAQGYMQWSCPLQGSSKTTRTHLWKQSKPWQKLRSNTKIAFIWKYVHKWTLSWTQPTKMTRTRPNNQQALVPQQPGAQLYDGQTHVSKHLSKRREAKDCHKHWITPLDACEHNNSCSPSTATMLGAQEVGKCHSTNNARETSLILLFHSKVMRC